MEEVRLKRQLELLGGWRLASALFKDFKDIYEYMLLKRQSAQLGALRQASALIA